MECEIPSTEIDMADNIAFRAHGWKEDEASNSNSDNSCIIFRVSAWSQRHHARMNNALGRLFLVLVCIFNIMTVVGVAAMKSNDRKIATRMLHSPITITGGEVARHRFRMHATTYSGSKSGKGDKSSSSKSGKSVMQVYQPIYMTPPTVHYQATEAETPAPTAAPDEATDLPTYHPSSVSSTINETLTPTAEFTTAKIQNLQMSLFGISDTELDSNQQQYFERQTATYMEEFYNIADGRNGLLDAIKNEVTDVMVTVTIYDQEYKHTDQLRDGTRAHTFIESQIGNNDIRYLQTSTKVSEPCEGSNNPLILTFSIYISYRLSGMCPIELEDVINFPFSSVSYRQNYIDDYLKSHGAAVGSEETDEVSNIEKDDQASAVFMDVYCTSRIDTAIENSELPTFAPTTDFPTLLPTFNETSAPSIIVSNAPSLKNTLPPLPTFDFAETSLPTISTQVAATGSPTYVPTTSTSSAAPTKFGETSAVPTTQSSSRLTTAPSTSLTPSLSQSFTLSTEPSPSTFTAGTVVPTSNATPQITSVIPTVAFEDNVGPADLTSVVEESLGLTLSPRPSNLEVENTFVPTISTFLNEVPTPSQSKPPTLLTKQNGFEAAVSDVSSQASSNGARPDQFQFSVTTPTPTVIDMFGNLRTADSASTERICSDTIRLVPVDRRDEFEVAFMYGVEYNSADIHDYVDDLENLILDFAAKSFLQCEGENEADAVDSRNLEAKNVYEGVIGIRYPEFGKITSICKSE